MRNTGIKNQLTLIFGLVVIAGLIWDPFLVGISVDTYWASPVTVSSLCTIDDILRGQVGRWPGTLSVNINAICGK